MFFKVTDKKLSKSYNKILERISSLVNTEFDRKPVYDDKYIKTKKVIWR